MQRLILFEVLEQDLQSRLVNIVSRSSRLGVNILTFARKSEMMRLNQVSVLTYAKIFSRFFYKGNNPLLKIFHKKT